MGAYTTVARVQARNPYRTIGASTSPSTSQVTEWIEEAEAEIDGRLAAIGAESPCTDVNGIKILRNRATTYVASLVAQAYAAAGGDDNADGSDDYDRWVEFLDGIQSNSVMWSGVLQQGSAESGAIKCRSHVTHNQDSLTKAAGDFDPEYEKEDIL